MTLKNKVHGFIALVGAPNAGKSTLSNTLLGQKLSIVSSKVQTTRNSIKAIVVEDNTQMILIDTPGLFIPREDRILERVIVKSAWQGLREADHICLLIDGTTGLDEDNTTILKDLRKEEDNLTVIITKTDLIKKSKILEIMAKLVDAGITNILPISSLNNDGMEALKKHLLAKCDNPEWPYDGDQITDAPMRFIASEITREKLFARLIKELPYSISVKTDEYQVLDNGQIKIHQTIFVLKDSQKGIILGKRGLGIKEIGMEAKKDIAEIAQTKIHLYLFVKVKPNWMNSIESYEKLDNPKLVS